MIELALYDYLTYPGDLNGASDTETFTAKTFGEITIDTRNKARQEIRNRVGKRIFALRKFDPAGHVAMLVRKISESPDHYTKGVDRDMTQLQIETVARGPNAALEIQIVPWLVRLATFNYRGTWSSDRHPHYIANCRTVNSRNQALNPRSGENYWSFRHTLDLEIASVLQ